MSSVENQTEMSDLREIQLGGLSSLIVLLEL